MKLSSMGAMICWVPVLHSRHRSIQGEQSHSRDGSALPFFDGGAAAASYSLPWNH